MLQAVAITLAVVAVLFLILRLVIRDAPAAELIVVGLLVPIFTFEHFINALQEQNGPMVNAMLKLMPTLLVPLLVAYLGLLVLGPSE